MRSMPTRDLSGPKFVQSSSVEMSAQMSVKRIEERERNCFWTQFKFKCMKQRERWRERERVSFLCVSLPFLSFLVCVYFLFSVSLLLTQMFSKLWETADPREWRMNVYCRISYYN